ncbi:MAG: hypothetical protein A2Y12_09810 [Planctomycetes bacterium GWF2_42_9]|nr:MAG: hypothetical protein A2Y12_09810 [Planctomycetes bacterium GWF2_42_9]
MKHVNLITLVLGIALVGQARADVIIGYDGFENHSNGAALITTDYPLTNDETAWLMPDTGTRWVRYSGQQNYSSVVTNSVAYSGSQSQSIYRTPGSGRGLYCGFGTGVAINVNHQYVFSGEYMNANDAYAADNCGLFYIMTQPTNTTQQSAGGFGYFGNQTLRGVGTGSTQDCMGVLRTTTGAWYYMDGTYANNHEGIGTPSSGIGSVMTPGDWYRIEMVVTIGAADGSGNYSFTYDTYFTDLTAGGDRALLRSNTAGVYKLTPAIVANGWAIMNGGNSVGTGNAWNQTYFDNLTITEIPEPATMAILGLGSFALIRRRIHV